MSVSNLMFERCKAYIDCRLAEGGFQRESVEISYPAFVTLNHETGSRAMPIAIELAKYLDGAAGGIDCRWTVFNENLVERILEDHNLPKRLAAFMPEDRTAEVKSVIGEILGLHPSSWTLFHNTVDTIRKLASLGQVILVGRGANEVTASIEGGLHVRLIGSLKKRIGYVSALRGSSPIDARKFIQKRDVGSCRYNRQHFGRSNENPHRYHMVINTDELDDQFVAEMIGDALIKRINLEMSTMEYV
jgi:cytidylate kinase